jgi:hypothetical protein
MELEVYWTDFSKKELKNIFDYYKENAGNGTKEQRP